MNQPNNSSACPQVPFQSSQSRDSCTLQQSAQCSYFTLMHKISPTMMFWKLLVGSSLPIKPLNTDILCKTSNALKWRLHVKPFSPARPIWLWRNHFHTWISARITYNWIHHQKHDTNVFMWVVDCTRRNHILAGWKEGESTSYKFRPTVTQFTTRK